MTTPEAALARVLVQLDDDDPGSLSELSIDDSAADGAARAILAALHDAGYALTPLAPEVPPPTPQNEDRRGWTNVATAAINAAPEVPPRRDGLRERIGDLDREPTLDEIAKYGLDGSPGTAFNTLQWKLDRVRDALAATRTPEPPDSGLRAMAAGEPLTAEQQIDLIRKALDSGYVLDRFAGSVPIFHRAEPPDSGDGAAPGPTDTMPESYAQIAALSEAATAGPWTPLVRLDADPAHVIPPNAIGIGAGEAVPAGVIADVTRVAAVASPANAAFIVAAVNHVRAALRLRSGSPAPEGGESLDYQRGFQDAIQAADLLRAAAPAEAREEGPVDG